MNKTSRKTFIHYEARVELVMWGDGTGTVHSLYSRRRGLGQATGVMRSLLRFADENGLDLTLEVRRFGHPVGPDNEVLKKFYEDLGFVVIRKAPGGSYFMHRTKREVLEPSQESRGL